MIYEILYSLYTLSGVNVEISGNGLTAYGYLTLFFVYAVERLAAYALVYFFRGFALYKMAKNRNVDKAYFAFIPFACYFLMGKLQFSNGRNSRTKNAWIVALAGVATTAGISLVIDLCFAIKPLGELFSGKILTSSSFSESNVAYNLLNWLSGVSELVFIVAALIAYNNIYKVYAPSKVTVYAIFNVLAYLLTSSSLLAAIFLFVNRNKQTVNYDEYVAEMRRKGGYSGGPSNGSFYGGGYANRPRADKPADDPFSEFSKNDESDPFADFGKNDSSGVANKNESTGNDKKNNGGNPFDDGSDDLF